MTSDEAISILTSLQEPEEWEPKITEKAFTALQMAIEALAKDTNVPSNDCISREAAIDSMTNTLWHYPNECYRNLNEYEFAKGLAELGLKSVPSVQPEPQWIPVSERLPEGYGNYLVSIRGEEPDIGTINPKDERGWSLCDATGFYWASEKKLDVIAWMPLPESYRGDTDDRNL